jgi:hypothetical protein
MLFSSVFVLKELYGSVRDELNAAGKNDAVIMAGTGKDDSRYSFFIL